MQSKLGKAWCMKLSTTHLYPCCWVASDTKVIMLFIPVKVASYVHSYILYGLVPPATAKTRAALLEKSLSESLLILSDPLHTWQQNVWRFHESAAFLLNFWKQQANYNTLRRPICFCFRTCEGTKVYYNYNLRSHSVYAYTRRFLNPVLQYHGRSFLLQLYYSAKFHHLSLPWH